MKNERQTGAKQVLPRRTRNRWTMYASAASAALAAPSAAQAAIVPLNVSCGVNVSALSCDLNGDGPADIFISVFQHPLEQSAMASFPNGAAYGTVFKGVFAGTNSVASVINSGARPTSSTDFNNNSLGLPANIPRTLGVSLSGGQNAWVKLRLDTAADGFPGYASYQSLAVLAGAFETIPGVPIKYGAVPEPSAFAFLGLLAAGAGGVAALKKHRQRKEHAES